MHTGKEETTTIFVFFSDKKKKERLSKYILWEFFKKKRRVNQYFRVLLLPKKKCVRIDYDIYIGENITDNMMIPYAFHKSTYTIHANLYDSDLLYLFLSFDTFTSFKFNEIKLN